MSDSRARIWFALFVLVVFCAGGATGMFVGRHMAPLGPGAPLHLFGRGAGQGPMGPMGGRGMGRGGGPGALPPDLVNRLSSELQLDDAQKAQIQRILDERRGRLEQVHREARQKFEEETRGLHEAIRATLRPNQQEQFDRMTKGFR